MIKLFTFDFSPPLVIRTGPKSKFFAVWWWIEIKIRNIWSHAIIYKTAGPLLAQKVQYSIPRCPLAQRLWGLHYDDILFTANKACFLWKVWPHKSLHNKPQKSLVQQIQCYPKQMIFSNGISVQSNVNMCFFNFKTQLWNNKWAT